MKCVQHSITKIIYTKYVYFLLVIPLLIFIASTWHGIGMTSDSFRYLAAAKSFNQSGEFKNSDGSTFINYPPLFPFLLSFILGHLQFWVGILNAVCLLGTIAVMFQLGRNLFNSSIATGQYLLVLLFGLPLYLVSNFVWSEPLFLLLVSLQLCVLDLYFKKPAVRYVLSLALLSILYSLQRKTGVFFIVGIATCILINAPDRNKIKHVILFLAIALLYIPIWIWTLDFNVSFNAALNHKPGLTNVSSYFIEALGNWIIPPVLPFSCKVIAVGLIMLLLFFFFYKNGNCTNKILLPYVFIFSIYFFVMQLFPYEDFTETERYLSVVYPIFFLIVFKVIDLLYDRLTAISSKRLLMIFISLWLLYPMMRTIKNVLFWYAASN